MGVEVRSHTGKGVTEALNLCRLLRTGPLCAFLACFGAAVLLGGCIPSSMFEEEPSASGLNTASVSTAQKNANTGPTAMDTFRALAPPQGIKYTQLFSEPLSDPEARAARLEREVQALRNDFDTVTPSLVRLVAIEQDMKELVRQLHTLTDVPPVPAVPPTPVSALPIPAPMATDNAAQQPPTPLRAPLTNTAPAAAPSAPGAQKIPGGDTAGGTETAGKTMPGGSTASSSLVTPEAAPKGELPPEGAASPNSSPARAKVKQVRTGDHPDKTRVVLDVSAKTPYKARLENGNMTLVIEAPGTDWSAIKPYDALSAALVAGWRVEGDKLILDLLYPSQIKSDSLLPPNGSPDHRLVVDLFSSDVHRQ